jgi:hypothetical protein
LPVIYVHQLCTFDLLTKVADKLAYKMQTEKEELKKEYRFSSVFPSLMNICHVRPQLNIFLSLYSNMGPVFRDIGKRMAGLSAAQTKISSQVGKIVKKALIL